MSITPNSLKAKRKNELREIASDLGLNTKGLRSELEERIRIHLENIEDDKLADATSSRTTPRRSVRKKSISSIKIKTQKENISLSPNGDRHSSDEENQSVSSESEKQDNITTPNASGIPETIISNNRINVFLLQFRKKISNSKILCQAVICLEFIVFLCAIEWRTLKIASIPNPFYSDDSEWSYYDLHIPDFFIFVEWHRFWRPLMSFILYLLLLPLGFSYIFNFEPHRYPYSPLTFSVAQYAIFMVSISNFDWTEDVRDFIPDNLIYMGAGAGAIFALYESILANS